MGCDFGDGRGLAAVIGWAAKPTLNLTCLMTPLQYSNIQLLLRQIMETFHYALISLVIGSMAYMEWRAYLLRSEGWTVIRMHPIIQLSTIFFAILITAPWFVDNVLSGIEPRITRSTIVGLFYIFVMWPIGVFAGWLLCTFQSVRWRHDELIFESVFPFSGAGRKKWAEISTVDRKNIHFLKGKEFELIMTGRNLKTLSAELGKPRKVGDRMVLERVN